MTPKIAFIERKYWKKDGLAFSIEKVFREIAGRLDGFATVFEKLPCGNGFGEILLNLLIFRSPPADIYHITGQIHYMALVLPPERTVLTIHDLGFLRRRKGIRRFLLKKLFLDLPVRRLRYVTAVSQATRDEIATLLPQEAAKVRVIGNPIAGSFRPAPEKGRAPQRPVILQVGITENKNIPRLLEALRGIECRLRVVGTPDGQLRDLILGSGTRTEIISGLNDEEMQNEYAEADIVSFCSTYEGFGLPILEAQAVGRPLLTSDLSPMREVAGGGALLVDPFDPASIRDGIERLIADADLRSKIVGQGFANVARFETAPIAAEYAALYAEILDKVTPVNI